jgi:cation:H+ antiporter
MMWTSIILFIAGFVLLVKGADLLVDGAASIAHKMGISSLIVGLTVVAFGTSAPELVVNLIASTGGNTDLAIGNVLGSNISNTLLILGVAALIYPITVKEGLIWKEIPFSLLAVIVLFLVANDSLIDGMDVSQISRSDGLIMLAFFILFVAYLLNAAKSGVLDKKLDHEKIQEKPGWISFSQVVAGIIGLTLGGKWIVDGALYFGEQLGVSQALMGLTVVAIGTSLPELATAIVAARKQHADIVLGNVIGSNIFNILLVLATTASITPLTFSVELNQDITTVVSTTILLLILILSNGKKIARWQGGLFVGMYVVYLAYLIFRG